MGVESMVCVLGSSCMTLRVYLRNVFMLKVSIRGYTTDENIDQVYRTHAKLLRNLDRDLSCLRQVYSNLNRNI